MDSTANNELLNIHSDIMATPVISFIKADGETVEVPSTIPDDKGGFTIHLEAALQYEALTRVVNGYLVCKRFDISEGFINKHVIIKKCRLYGGSNNQMMIEVDFGGSYSGTAYFDSTPYYNATTKKIELQHVGYDLKTNSFLLKAARWLFDKHILSEIKKYTAFDMANYYMAATESINLWLNKEWTKGIKATGSVSDITLTGVYPQQAHLIVRSHCSGQLSIAINELNLKF